MWFWEADCNTQQTKELQTLRLKNFPVAGYCALAIFFFNFPPFLQTDLPVSETEQTFLEFELNAKCWKGAKANGI